MKRGRRSEEPRVGRAFIPFPRSRGSSKVQFGDVHNWGKPQTNATRRSSKFCWLFVCLLVPSLVKCDWGVSSQSPLSSGMVTSQIHSCYHSVHSHRNYSSRNYPPSLMAKLICSLGVTCCAELFVPFKTNQTGDEIIESNFGVVVFIIISLNS